MNDKDMRALQRWNQMTPEESAELARLREDARAHNESAIRSLRRDGVLDPDRAERLLDDYARPSEDSQ